MTPTQLEIPCLSYSLAADWYEGKDPAHVLLVLIAWNSKKASNFDLVSHLVTHTKASALVLDYSGHGESPFELRDVSPAQNFLEVVTVFDWLKAQYPDKKISLVGTSYGGFLAVQLLKYRQFNNLVLRVPAIYRPEAFYDKWAVRLDNEQAYRQQLHEYRVNTELLKQHPLLARVSHFAGNTLVVVHENDDMVPKQTTDAYIDTFKADSYLAKGFKHPFNTSAPEEDKLAYKNTISDWLNKRI